MLVGLVLALHATAFAVIGYPEHPAFGSLAVIGMALLATRFTPYQTVGRLTVAGFAVLTLTSAALAMTGIAPSMSDVRIGPLFWPQVHAFGIIPSMTAMLLMLGLRFQPSHLERGITAVAVLATGSLTGWLFLWPMLYGWRGLGASAMVVAVALLLPGDLSYKLTGRAMEEVMRQVTVYHMATGVSLLIAGLGALRRDLRLTLLGLYGLRMGSGLWLDPLVIAAVLMAHGARIHVPRPHPHGVRHEAAVPVPAPAPAGGSE